MNHSRRYFILCLLILSFLGAIAQENAPFNRDRWKDSTRQQTDSTRIRRGGGMSSLFADSSQLNSSDYQLQIEKTYVVLNNIENKSELGLAVLNIKKQLADSDSVLLVLKDILNNDTRGLNLRNLQVFRTLLQNIRRDLKEHRTLLDSTENKLVSLKGTMKTLIADTVLRQLLQDSVMRRQFSTSLKDMREVWRASTRHLKRSLATVNLLQTRTSSNSITSSQLLEKVDNLLNTSTARIFSKEYHYLWQKDTDSLSQGSRDSFVKAYQGERKALHYYFRDSGNNRVLLLVIGLLFFVWIYRNVRYLRKTNELASLDLLGFDYLPSGFVVSAFVVTFSVAPLFDLHAPSVYIESVQFFLLIILTVICWKKWPRQLFIYWIAMAVLYILFSFTHHIADPGFWQRWWLVLLNILSIVFGLLFLSKMQKHLELKGFLRFVIILHNILNVISILCNIWGRFSLAQMLGNAAIFSFTQAIGLAVFSKICMESILLQMVASRMRRGVKSPFEYRHVLDSFKRPVFFLVVVLWLIVFATNLNIYTTLLNTLTEVMKTPRNIGNASFTLGGVLLFFLIIWIAHLLQKYVGYFFGDAGTDDELQNKGQRSRLLIARLILLCLGYLLAVAASGVPVDKITIVLGALGVGIGLGLQNIVNNFVSGIILIFDRPLQIGDLVEVGDKSGRVRAIGLRSSTLLTASGAEVIIPNGDILSHQITNWTLSNNQKRLESDLTVTGSNDMEIVASAIKKAILLSDYVFESRPPQVLFTKVLENGFELKVFFWCKDVFRSEEAKSEILLLLYKTLHAENLSVA